MDENKLAPETEEEAEAFLSDCLAVVLTDLSEVRDYLDQLGMDVSDLDDEELAEAEEVFCIPDGRYLVLEG